MNIKSILLSGAALSIVLSFSTNSVASESGLKYIGEYTIPTSFAWKNVPFGGLSAIRWHEGEQRFYAISDSRNTPTEGKPRFYKLKIDVSSSGIKDVIVEQQYDLLDADGEAFKKGFVDAEGLVITPENQLLWSSEAGSPLRKSTLTGKFVEDLSAIFPEGYSVDSKKEDPEGFRSGISWEGLSFTPDSQYLYVAAEGALKQDGPLASPMNSSPARILKFRYNGDDKKPQLEKSFLYNVDPVSHISKFAINDNGVSEVLALNENKLLVVERSGRNASEGFNDWDFTVKVWLADTATSTDIKEIKSLAQVEKRSIIQPVVKKLLIDFSDVTNAPDCIEGVTFGPLIDGKKTLIFVSDNNFQPYQNTKFYLFQDVNDVLK
uniref:esterase-like activity of phytase family protein n=1 Tax=Klebsiella sp. TaxID=576 RepID=UPI0025898749|nr:esterase-like activity of phytase family protein [Klebsiella sp.]